MRDFIQSLVQDESGVTAVEYAILAAIVVGVLGLASVGFKAALTDAWTAVTTGLNDASGAGS
ncbi:Flp family type IVb pilin [Alcaligenaceae bacterium CGII-47]|nr:Flp family type IVb pilin [Alcaligenaceae bacterium CGII-47]